MLQYKNTPASCQVGLSYLILNVLRFCLTFTDWSQKKNEKNFFVPVSADYDVGIVRSRKTMELKTSYCYVPNAIRLCFHTDNSNWNLLQQTMIITSRWAHLFCNQVVNIYFSPSKYCNWGIFVKNVCFDLRAFSNGITDMVTQTCRQSVSNFKQFYLHWV